MVQHFGNSAINGGNVLVIIISCRVEVVARLDISTHAQTTKCIPGMQALYLFISHSALQDSAARDPPPRCFPGTRKKEKEIIRRWIEQPNPCSSVFLIQGRTRSCKGAPARESRTGTRLVSPAVGCQKKKKKKDTFRTQPQNMKLGRFQYITSIYR
jgi:hypothetical protein